jgi:tetratricopeptide (TPR) repeat protein
MRVPLRIIAAAGLALAATNAAGAQTPRSELWQSSGSPNAAEAERWAQEGKSRYEAGEYKEAAASFERALQLRVGRPHDAALNIARSYARLDNRKQALRWIAHALDLGLPDVERLYEEPAFARYRGDEKFLSLASRKGRREGPASAERSLLLIF